MEEEPERQGGMASRFPYLEIFFHEDPQRINCS